MSTLTVLNYFEEDAALQMLKKDARTNCDKEIKALFACTTNKLFSMAWLCRDAKKAMEQCFINNSGEAKLDEYREKVLKVKEENFRKYQQEKFETESSQTTVDRMMRDRRTKYN